MHTDHFLAPFRSLLISLVNCGWCSGCLGRWCWCGTGECYVFYFGLTLRRTGDRAVLDGWYCGWCLWCGRGCGCRCGGGCDLYRRRYGRGRWCMGSCTLLLTVTATTGFRSCWNTLKRQRRNFGECLKKINIWHGNSYADKIDPTLACFCWIKNTSAYLKLPFWLYYILTYRYLLFLFVGTGRDFTERYRFPPLPCRWCYWRTFHHSLLCSSLLVYRLWTSFPFATPENNQWPFLI